MHLFWRSGSFFSFGLRCLRPDRGKQPTSGKRLFPPGRRIWEQNKIKLCEHIYIQWQNKTKQKINTILSRQLECVMCDILKKKHTHNNNEKRMPEVLYSFYFQALESLLEYFHFIPRHNNIYIINLSNLMYSLFFWCCFSLEWRWNTLIIEKIFDALTCVNER